MAKHTANEEAPASRPIGNRGDSKGGKRQGAAGDGDRSRNQPKDRFMGQPGKHRKN